MPIKYKRKVAVFKDICEIEEAESLLEWLIEKPKGQVNLKQLKIFHTAILQVLMAIKPTISVWPEDQGLNDWLQPLLIDGK